MHTEKLGFIFIGRSGCGKGTQAELLMKKINENSPLSLYYLESGANFRKFIQGEEYSNILSKSINEVGGLQPEFLAVWVWSHLLVENLKPKQHLVLDGTPRKLREASVLETALDFYGYKKVYVFNIGISREESKKRLILRGRSDDKKITDIENRLNWFDTDVVPTIEFYRNNPRYSFFDINGEQLAEKVHEDIMQKLAL